MALFTKTPHVEPLTPKHETYRFGVLLAFSERELVAPHLDKIREAAAFIPKYWTVSEEDRAFVRQLLGEGRTTVSGSAVCFDLSVEADAECLVRRVELLQEKARSWEGSRFYLGDSLMATCEVAVGGLLDSVKREIEEWLSASEPRAASGASCGM